MNRTAKVILGIVVGLLALCIITTGAGIIIIRSAGTVLARSLQTDPQKASAIASSIAEYSLPDGFGSPYATRLAGFSLVQYTHTDGHSHVTFFQIPNGIKVDPAEMERQFRQNAPDRNHSRADRIKMVNQVQGTINGQPVTLVVSEGTNSDEQPFREVSGLFQGKGGQAMVVYEAPLSRWDQAEVDAFLASIHN